MTHKSSTSPKCVVPISSLVFFFIAIFCSPRYSYNGNNCVIDTILSTFYTFSILPAGSSFSSTYEVYTGTQNRRQHNF